MRVSLSICALCMFAVSGLVVAESQSDWSGGGSDAGIVEHWGDSFSSVDGLSWLAIPGQLALSSIVLENPEKHDLDSGFAAAYGLYAFDVDRDGDTDLIGTTDSGAGVFIWLNNGGDPGEWERLTVDADYPGGTSVHPVDLDKDGDIDIVGAAQTPGQNVAWWRNDGGFPTVWTRQIIDDFVLVACSVFAADVDGDEDIDVLSTSWPVGQYFQYRVLMESDNPDVSPILKKVRVSNTEVVGQTEMGENVIE